MAPLPTFLTAPFPGKAAWRWLAVLGIACSLARTRQPAPAAGG